MDQYEAAMVDPRWYWVNRGRYWLIHDGTGSVWGVLVDQQRAVMVDT